MYFLIAYMKFQTFQLNSSHLQRCTINYYVFRMASICIIVCNRCSLKLPGLKLLSLWIDFCAITSITNKWKYITWINNIPKKQFIKAVKIVLESTFFTFNNTNYKQNYGTPMGSPLSSFIAEIVMQNLENKALERFGINLSFT